jgi:O-antigen ligase
VIRYSLLVIAMLVIAIMAQKNWYRALCFMLPMLAVLERPDMPRQMLGISGFNPFNILLGIILIAWFFQRRYDGSHWTAGKTATRLFIAYMVVIGVSVMRAYFDVEAMAFSQLLAGREEIVTKGSFIMDNVVNSAKWMIPGLLISVGAKSEERVRLAAIGLLLTGALLSLQVISKMLPGLIGADDLASRALRVLDRDIGYHRVNLAAITASAAWAFLAAKPILKTKFRGAISLGGFGLCTIAMIATGGRMGMLAWLSAAIVFGFLRWRKMLVLIPILGILAIAVIPGLRDRVLQGFTGDDATTSAQQFERRSAMGAIDESGRDRYSITSGRVVVWPMVFEKAMEKPIIGHGQIAMQRTGIVERLNTELRITTFGHPHNAYLQLFIDTGIVGIIIIGMFYWILFRNSVRAFRQPRNETEYVIASIVIAFFVVNLAASLGSQSFYPKQGATLFWIAIGLALAWFTNESPEPEQASAPAGRPRGPRPPARATQR